MVKRTLSRLRKVDKRIAFAGAFIVIGGLTLLATKAATPTVHFEAESATNASCATSGSDVNASGGQFLRFSSAACTGGGALNLPRIPWDGGPGYYAQFQKANAAGWDDPSFIPISVFIGQPGDASEYRSIGINTYVAVNHDVSDTSYTPRIKKATDPDRNPATEDGVFVMPHKEYEGPGSWEQSEVGDDVRAVSWFITDECEMGYSGCGNGDWDQFLELSTQKTRTAEVRAYNDGRMMHSNFGNGVARTFWSPDTFDEHLKLMDTEAVDKYAYTSPDVDGVIEGSKNWPKNANPAVSAAYGWIVDQMRMFQKAETSPGNPTPAEPESLKPAWAYVETARPLLGESGAGVITPNQMEGAVWSSIIHEARGVAYFQHSNDPCGLHPLGVEVQTATCQTQYQNLRNKLISMHTSIRTLAPVINTQSYVWNFSNDGNAANNSDTMLKTYNGFAYIFAGIGLEYTGVDNSDCDVISLETVCKKLGTNQPIGNKNFILPAGVSGTTVEVVGESRTIPVTNGQFTDNFAAEYTHHIYKIAL